MYRGEIDVAITRASRPSAEESTIESIACVTPWFAVLPRSRELKSKRFGLPTLLMNDSYFFTEKEHLVFSTPSSERVESQGFSPRVENEPNSMQTILSWLRLRKA